MWNARKESKKRARNVGVIFENDYEILKPYSPPWIKEEYWKSMYDEWNTSKWKERVEKNQANKARGSVAKHTTGSVKYVVKKMRLEEEQKGPVSWGEVYLESHITKVSRIVAKEGTRDVEFVTPEAKHTMTLLMEMTETFGPDVTSHPLGDMAVWERVVRGRKKGKLKRTGSVSDPRLLITGTPSDSSVTSFVVHSGVASAEERLSGKKHNNSW